MHAAVNERMGKKMKTKILIENSDCSTESSYYLSLSQLQKILFGELLYDFLYGTAYYSVCTARSQTEVESVSGFGHKIM